MALLFRDLGKRVEIRSARDGRIRFRRHVEAVQFLQQHRDEDGLIDALRQALEEHDPVEREDLSDDEVIEEIERRLMSGSLQLLEIFEPWARGRVSLGQEQPEEAIAVHGPPVKPPVPPLLPLLVEVQIEGAEVLPEIMQTLDQIDLTMAGIDLASVSLEPAPSGVPAITSTMQQASDSVTATLEGM